MGALRSPGGANSSSNNNAAAAAAVAAAAASSPGGRMGLGSARPASELLLSQYLSSNQLASASAAQAQFANAPNSGGGGLGGLATGTPEVNAIDKWFEDLQHYEATLEEMAAASLDSNFKEELSAIEQWFRVLSEAERTAALYSLLQESTQVQIRFFITVLQQMARTDPVSALLSPGAGHNSLMAEQMENKLASLGLKSPSAMKAPNSAASFRAQSEANSGFLSPNAAAGGFGSAASNNSNNNSSNNAGDSNSLLAAQRAKLKSNRISAPGHLASIGGDCSNFTGLTLDQVAEAGGRSVSPGLPSPGIGGEGQLASVRPKSTDGLGALASARAAGAKSPRTNGPLDDALSPLANQGPTGSWASMMNTPMMPMFNDDISGSSQQQQDASATLDGAAAKLGGTNDDSAAGARKFSNRKAGQASVPGGFNLGANSNLAGVQGVLSGIYGGAGADQYGGAAGAQLANLSNLPPGVSQAQLSAAFGVTSAALGVPNTAGLSPNINAAQWVNQQNELLRSPLASAALTQMSPNALAGLQSPSGGLANPLNMQMMNAMAAMGGLGNVSAAQLFALQNQVLQHQAGLTGQFAGIPMSAGPGAGSFGQAMGGFGGGAGGLRSAGLGGRNAFGGPGLSVGTQGTRDKPQRSPRIPGNNLPASARAATFASSGSGGGGASAEDEVADLSTLNDTAAWLRQLRLHKYTSNFEHDHWRDMVLMDEKALEDKGVAALGARRKMLKTFENVRAKYGIKMPGDEAGGANAAAKKDDAAAKEGAGAEGDGSAAAAAENK
ncbi:hypothetical protein K437DRAFT_278482 [Tilletiaria anomala UBC 951]|uniref:SAM domain-containing protein n=1 Tax=Tilletiaria anomala (strain ATCC 24038 / CBS 436.72 / UBC 951) TaxID=1037660 RepID=A0A066VYE7_TILAU|nr:uncharacterized protein K437DRAFT_278482 [Tilletiaria anomala UBC 951]KDN45303.1 hypothetical protein K437DRAFT_278482 [Tilletiaria anomala UBC 951]